MSPLQFSLNNPHWSDNRRKITLTDKSFTKYEGTNSKGKIFSLFRIDKDNLISGQKKCDYLLVSTDETKAYFIELKGRHLLEAVEQIKQSLDVLKPHLNIYKINGRIVLSRTNAPDLQNPKYIKLKKLLISTGGTLEQQTKVFKEKL